ncbi:MAG: hypothetical protein R3211_07875 [Balneolaceae bacterium]|nr:hypothetical protein [Balneolaceae bacterium]
MNTSDSSRRDADARPVSFEKLKELDSLFDSQLNDITKEERVGTKDKSRSGSSSIGIKKILLYLSGSLLFLVLPFIVLIRSSVYLYLNYQFNGWIALGGGVTATIVLLLIYLAGVGLKFRSKARIHRYFYRGVIVLVIAYSCYSLLYLSGMNVKKQELQTHYMNLHPILRVAVSTAILADSELIITDIQRTPDDYDAMGLSRREHSNHYLQSSGYVHAVDLRTIDRAEWKNWILQRTANLLGFHTLRHTGTADHLHVALPLNGS